MACSSCSRKQTSQRDNPTIMRYECIFSPFFPYPQGEVQRNERPNDNPLLTISIIEINSHAVTSF